MAFELFPKIQIVNHGICHLFPGNGVLRTASLFPDKLQQNLIASHSGMGNFRIAFFLIVLSQFLVQGKRILKKRLYTGNSILKLSAVIVHFYHTFHHFQAQDVLVRQPFGSQYLIRLLFFVHDLVLFHHLFHMRAFQHLQKSKLKLLGLQCVHVVEGSVKAFIVLVGKTCDQIQVLVNILKTMNAVYDFCQPWEIHGTVNGTDSVRICGLYSNLQLDQSRAHSAHQLQFILPDQVCGNLKMEVGDSIVVILYVLPDGHRMVMLAVKGSVHKFYLRHLVIQEKLQFLFDQVNISES